MLKRVYQFKITLKGINPPIWRRILVPENYNFWDLHVAIQDAMGWLDCHLHVFCIRRKHAHKVTEIGIPNEDIYGDEPVFLPGWEIPISRYFSDLGEACNYEYDFGDSWKHEVLLEGLLIREKGQKYPKCLDGERACPPEDCGSVPGYYNLLEILSDTSTEEYEEMVSWLGGKYKPEKFNPEKVKFDNPKKRWRQAFTED